MLRIKVRFFWIIVSIISIVVSACSNITDENISPEANSPLRELISLNVYKSPTCGCCGKWVEYMENNGFSAHTHDSMDLAAIKAEHGVKPQYRSCHTAVSTDGFVFEGHIPAKFIHQFLSDKPEGAIGLAVPAMPVGSPGMEVDDKFMPYQVLMIKKDGGSEIYADVGTREEQL